MMSEEQFATLLQFFKVLGNESRLKILGLLANQERSVGELAEFLNLREPTVSHHLAAMKEIGLVDVRAEGNVRIYRLETHALEKMSKDLFSQESLSTLAANEAGDSWEQKVFRTYVADDRLKQIPTQYKKRMVILRWLVTKFEMNATYTEKEVSERLKQYHPDYAALRRYLVETRLMQRENGIYWRLPESESET
jgi:DNA-binding HxlR family transcriptional regulator